MQWFLSIYFTYLYILENKMKIKPFTMRNDMSSVSFSKVVNKFLPLK